MQGARLQCIPEAPESTSVEAGAREHLLRCDARAAMLMAGSLAANWGQGEQDGAGPAPSTATAALQHPALLDHFLQPAAYAGAAHGQALAHARDVCTAELLLRTLGGAGSAGAAPASLAASAQPYLHR